MQDDIQYFQLRIKEDLKKGPIVLPDCDMIVDGYTFKDRVNYITWFHVVRQQVLLPWHIQTRSSSAVRGEPVSITTLYAACQLFDKVMLAFIIPSENDRILSCVVCLWIALKVHEEIDNYPRLEYLCQQAQSHAQKNQENRLRKQFNSLIEKYSNPEIAIKHMKREKPIEVSPAAVVKLERDFLSMFNFDVFRTTSLDFIQEIASFKTVGKTENIPLEYSRQPRCEVEKTIYKTARYFSKIALIHDTFSRVPNAIVAACCVACARHHLGFPKWSWHLEKCTNLEFSQLKSVFNGLITFAYRTLRLGADKMKENQNPSDEPLTPEDLLEEIRSRHLDKQLQESRMQDSTNLSTDLELMDSKSFQNHIKANMYTPQTITRALSLNSGSGKGMNTPPSLKNSLTQKSFGETRNLAKSNTKLNSARHVRQRQENELIVPSPLRKHRNI